MKGKILHWHGVLLDHCFSGGGIKLIILHGKKILWDKIGETAVKWISVAKIGEQWTGEHGWNRPLAVILNCAFKVFLEICQNIPQDLRCFKKSLYFQSIYTREISLKSVLANACSGSFLSPIRHWSIRLIGSIGKWRNLQEWTSVTDSWTVGLNMGELAMKLYFLILCSKTYNRFSWKSCTGSAPCSRTVDSDL